MIGPGEVNLIARQIANAGRQKTMITDIAVRMSNNLFIGHHIKQIMSQDHQRAI
jgi:hypothetical protein